MKRRETLTTSACRGLTLRSIDHEDLERLRRWKNENREAFFFKGTISEQDQRDWYEAYLERPRDFMFIVEVEGCAVGCMGIRLLEDGWDVYNVIRSEAGLGGKGYMSRALDLMCAYASRVVRSSISAKVLRANPALSWYRGRGFEAVDTKDDYVLIRLRKNHAKLEEVGS